MPTTNTDYVRLHPCLVTEILGFEAGPNSMQAGSNDDELWPY
jgi:hypothetical protein